MKIASLIARLLMGLVFAVFGLNGFAHFLPQPPLPAGTPAAEFFHATAVSTHYMTFVFGVQLACGLAFLAGAYVPLALAVIAPVIVNILLFHALMAPAGIAPGLVVAALWVVVAVRYRAAFAGLFRVRPAAPAGAVA